ncbi:MAG: accessory factor UbiK family protein [Steroidobacteraceae bacterium]
MEQLKIDELAQRLFQSLPPGLKAARDDIEKNFRSALRAGLSRLDVTTREEFDAQSKVLERTREMVEKLEKRVQELEGRLESLG